MKGPHELVHKDYLLDTGKRIAELDAENERLTKQHNEDCHDMYLVRCGLVKTSREYVRMSDELDTLRNQRHYASAYLQAVDALKLIANRMPGCPCMDAPNLAKEALERLGVK